MSILFIYLDGVIYSNSFSINRYIELTKAARPGVMASHQLTLTEQAQYIFLLKMFSLSMDKAKMQDKFGNAYQHLLHKELKLFKWLGVIDDTNDEYRLSQQGMYYWVDYSSWCCLLRGLSAEASFPIHLAGARLVCSPVDYRPHILPFISQPLLVLLPWAA